MPRKKKTPTDRVLAAAKLLVEAPILSVPKAMLAEGFTKDEVSDRVAQMQVRRCFQDLKASSAGPPPEVFHQKLPVSPLSTSVSSRSSLARSSLSTSVGTVSTAATASATATASAPGVKIIRKTIGQAQQHRVNRRKEKKKQSTAFKQATVLYDTEKKKKKKG